MRNLIEEEIKLETHSVNMGKIRYRKSQEKLNLVNSGRGSSLINRTIPFMIQYINTWKSKKGRLIKHGSIRHILIDLKSEELAYLAVRTAFNNAEGQGIKLQSLLLSLGTEVETHINLMKLKKQQGWLVDLLVNRQSSNNLVAIKRTLKAHKIDTKLNTSTKINIGKFLWEGLSFTHIFNWVDGRVQFSQEALLFMKDSDKFLESIKPLCLPMVVPPLPWEDKNHGGYLKSTLINKSLIQSYPGYDGWVNDNVLTFVNNVQSVGFRLNNRIVDIFKKCMSLGTGIAGLPLDLDHLPPLIPVPFSPELDEKEAEQLDEANVRTSKQTR